MPKIYERDINADYIELGVRTGRTMPDDTVISGQLNEYPYPPAGF